MEESQESLQERYRVATAAGVVGVPESMQGKLDFKVDSKYLLARHRETGEIKAFKENIWTVDFKEQLTKWLLRA